jgi:hypothetical protein
MFLKRTLALASVVGLSTIVVGCPMSKQMPPSAPALKASCTVDVDEQYVMTNPITINPTPKLNAKVAGFTKHTKLSYEWEVFPNTALISGSGKSVTIDIHNITERKQVDVTLQVSATDGTSANCDGTVSTLPAPKPPPLAQ